MVTEMEIIRGLDKINREFKDTVVTIGNFDGVHLGHQLLFDETRQQARSIGGESLVMTFEPHPVRVLRPESNLKLISKCSKKIELIEKAGVDVLLCISFSREFAETTCDQFVDNILWSALHVKGVIVGYDYSFGKGRKGTIDFLKQKGKDLGFTVTVIEPLYVDGIIVSSTKIRELIAAGEMRAVRKLLGRPYQMSGTVLVGKRRGGSVLGFPTANIELSDNELAPKLGVYAVQVFYDGKSHDGVMNIGYNPTFGDLAVSAEVHIFDFSEDVYGEKIEVNIIERLRDEKKFPGPAELIEQIKNDVERAKEILRTE
ncbi:MAG: bifunctional riboflavin kinase/FAD synthetase [Pseudomonadota bacterium]